MKSYPCDCYCYGSCPGPLVLPAKFVLAEAVCPREPVYELVYELVYVDPEEGRVMSSLFCTECTTSARERDREAGEIRSIRMIPP